MNATHIEEFKQFLKSKRAFSSFTKELKEYNRGGIVEYSKRIAVISALDSGFIWKETEKGFDFWAKLNAEWVDKHFFI